MQGWPAFLKSQDGKRIWSPPGLLPKERLWRQQQLTTEQYVLELWLPLWTSQFSSAHRRDPAASGFL